MRFIITGGTGLIGRALTSSLAADGHEVIILGRNPARATGLSAGVRIEGWDGCTATGWGNLVEGADGIINLASENIAGDSWFSIRWSKERKKQILDSRINAGNAVSEAIRLAQKKPIPDFFFKIIFGEVATILLEGQWVIPKHLLEMGYQFKLPDAELALKDLLLTQGSFKIAKEV